MMVPKRGRYSLKRGRTEKMANAKLVAMPSVTSFLKTRGYSEMKGKDYWPEHIKKPTNEEIGFLAKMSERNTSSSFFDSKKRGNRDGKSTSCD